MYAAGVNFVSFSAQICRHAQLEMGGQSPFTALLGYATDFHLERSPRWNAASRVRERRTRSRLMPGPDTTGPRHDITESAGRPDGSATSLRPTRDAQIDCRRAAVAGMNNDLSSPD